MRRSIQQRGADVVRLADYRKSKGRGPISIPTGDSPFERTARKILGERAAKCAAWLIGAHRYFFHRNGEVRLYAPPGGDKPAWFALAIDHLRSVPGRWKVETWMEGVDGREHYRVRWLGRGKWRPPARPHLGPGWRRA